MRIIILIIIIISITNVCFSQEYVDMDIISWIESRNNDKAVGLAGEKGRFQITKICLDDYNNYNYNNYIHIQMHNYESAYIVAYWYLNIRIPSMLRYYNYPVTLENILTAYNCGIMCVVEDRVPQSTINYINIYKERINK